MSAFKSKVWALAFTAERRGLGDVGRQKYSYFSRRNFCHGKTCMPAKLLFENRLGPPL